MRKRNALLLMILIVTSTSCNPSYLVANIPPVPRAPQAAKDELRSGQCPVTNEWLRRDVVPYFCELRSHGDDPCDWKVE